MGGPWWVLSLFRWGWPTFPSVLWCCWLVRLTCKTVSRITYTVLVESDVKPCSIQSNPSGDAENTRLENVAKGNAWNTMLLNVAEPCSAVTELRLQFAVNNEPEWRRYMIVSYLVPASVIFKQYVKHTRKTSWRNGYARHQCVYESPYGIEN